MSATEDKLTQKEEDRVSAALELGAKLEREMKQQRPGGGKEEMAQPPLARPGGGKEVEKIGWDREREVEMEAKVREDQSSYQIKHQFRSPLVYYREKGLAKVEQVVPALVLTVVDDDEPYRRTLQIFTEQGDHIVRNATFDKEKVGCWFPIS